MTLSITSVGTLLSSLFFLGLLVFWFYRNNYTKKEAPKEVAVPLKVDRSALLTDQRRQVMLRRNKLANPPIATRPESGHVVASASSVTASSQAEPVEEGFGEDLGAALSLASQAEVKPKKSKSRFAALQDAADQFKDIYNRNNQL